MVYIRIKRFKRKNGEKVEFAYFVENKWRKRVKSGKIGARQKVKGYLGRVFRVDRVNEKGFFDHYGIDVEGSDGDNGVKKYLRGKSREEIVSDLIKLELFNHGFKEEVRGRFMVNGDMKFDVRGKWVSHGSNGNVALAMNEGYLCRYLVKRLGSGFFGGNEKEVGYKLAKAFVEAGLKVPKEIFVGVYEKVVK
ncbi:MAG: hypothetical protein QF824_02975 [Candidatus Woesearchaeota archaeon]|nr:hypothetical protein [Candidatus Woesearchaeota archaeon]